MRRQSPGLSFQPGHEELELRAQPALLGLVLPNLSVPVVGSVSDLPVAGSLVRGVQDLAQPVHGTAPGGVLPPGRGGTPPGHGGTPPGLGGFSLTPPVSVPGGGTLTTLGGTPDPVTGPVTGPGAGTPGGTTTPVLPGVTGTPTTIAAPALAPSEAAAANSAFFLPVGPVASAGGSATGVTQVPSQSATAGGVLLRPEGAGVANGAVPPGPLYFTGPDGPAAAANPASDILPPPIEVTPAPPGAAPTPLAPEVAAAAEPAPEAAVAPEAVAPEEAAPRTWYATAAALVVAGGCWVARRTALGKKAAAYLRRPAAPRLSN